MPIRNLIPAEFTYENFTGIIQDIQPDTDFYALKNIFPMKTITGQKIRNTILNLSRRIATEGVRNFGDASANVDKLGYAAKEVDMFPFKVNNIFDESDFNYLNNLGDKDREIQVANWISENMANLKNRIMTTWEYFCWKLLLGGGVLDLTDNTKGVHYKYDFEIEAAQKEAANTLTSTAVWSDYTSGVSNPLKNIQTWKKKLKDIGGIAGASLEMLANSNTWETFRGNPKVTSDATLSDFIKGEFFAGSLTGKVANGARIVVVDNNYENTAGTITDYIPDGYVIMKAAGALGDMQMGTSTVSPAKGQITTVNGMYSVPMGEMDPPAMKVVTGFTGMINLQKRFSFLAAKVY